MGTFCSRNPSWRAGAALTSGTIHLNDAFALTGLRNVSLQGLRHLFKCRTKWLEISAMAGPKSMEHKPNYASTLPGLGVFENAFSWCPGLSRNRQKFNLPKFVHQGIQWKIHMAKTMRGEVPSTSIAKNALLKPCRNKRLSHRIYHRHSKRQQDLAGTIDAQDSLLVSNEKLGQSA